LHCNGDPLTQLMEQLHGWVNEKFFRIFFATDVHGSDKTFLKFLKAATFYKCDVLILGGDLTGKTIIPILKNDDGRYEMDLLGGRFSAKDESELAELEGRVMLLGFYPYRTTKGEWAEQSAESSKYDALYDELAVGRMKKWTDLAAERLAGTNVPIFVTGGNDDPYPVLEFLRSQNSIISSEDKVIKFGEIFTMVSLGYSNHTPWKTPRECSEEDLARKIDQVASEVPDQTRTIFNFHVPPFTSSIDTATQVDASVNPPKYVLRNGMPIMISVGSTAIRAAIEKYQPLLGLHGHIHESRGAIKIGRTICINPGSEYSEGILKGVMVNLDDNGVKSYQFTSG